MKDFTKLVFHVFLNTDKKTLSVKLQVTLHKIIQMMLFLFPVGNNNFLSYIYIIERKVKQFW